MNYKKSSTFATELDLTIKNFYKMKKSLVAMAAMLSMSAAFVSCSKTDLYDEAAAEKANQLKAEAKYKEAFVKHFGEVDPNQSWDFSKTNIPVFDGQNAARTRSVTYYDEPIWKTPSYFTPSLLPTYYRHVYTDQAAVIACAEDESLNPVEWPYKYSEVRIHPFYGKGTRLFNECAFGLEFKSYLVDLGFLGNYTVYTNEGLFSFSLGNGWDRIYNHDPLGTFINMYSYRYVKTDNMVNADGFKWWVQAGSGTKTELTMCKQFTVNGHTYVALDCNGDGKYTDVVCWIEDLAPSKRYMVEDMGSIGDFDFNDIVFDVEYNAELKKYECVVRAMGGTLNFTIRVGKTYWTKSTKYDKNTMYNTKPSINYEEEYDRFEVEGWIPEKNDVEVIVEGKDGSTFVMPFPKDGDIPFIVCTSIGKDWANEKTDVKTIGWFGYVENDVTKTVAE